ncbi:MAG: hypothetical protein GPOALKHO_001964 [Sodalis sp.]|uniref:hypothetical protein n=1 Tax=Sodalis sp. (in: enterobacteria) TaxID=1898979 RepID=UPI003873AEB9|nr:MAG: hypothetical protein GPOALKHO_001964 [Sodalis sp.]
MLAGATYLNGKGIPLARWDRAALPATVMSTIPPTRVTGVVAVTAQTPQIDNILRNYHIGGVILFANNLDSLSNRANRRRSQTHSIGLLISTDRGRNVFACHAATTLRLRAI